MPNLALKKDEVTKVLVWLKMHKVPLVAYSEDGLSLIATQIGKPIILDAITSSMYEDPWGRLRYAHALIEVSADKPLKKDVIIAVPEEDGTGHTLEKIYFEYEWKPPVCMDCHVFRHSQEQCPKQVKEQATETKTIDNDGFTTVNKKNKKGKIIQKWQPRVSEINAVNATYEPADDGEESEVEEVNIEHSTIKGASTPLSAGNAPSKRRQLWNELDIHKHMVNNSPWIMLGDFNVALNMEYVSVGSSSMNSAINDFKECVANLKVPGAHAMFQPYRILDHSPAVLKFPTIVSNKPKPFKYYNFLAYKDKFGEVLKKPLRKLLHDQGNLHDRVLKLRKELDEVQIALDKNPNDSTLRDEESVYIQAFTDAKIDEEHFLKQKAKVYWLEVGDANSGYFHKTIKSKNHRSRITSILDANDIEVTGLSVPNVFVKHYEQFLGSNMPCEMLDVTDLFLNQVSDSSNTNMVWAISNEEIKAAMFNIGDDRAPGPDGFT
ncbi:zinc knuckle CX2CX4HX4C containing protein [Tanacetum coccineum]